VSPDADRTDGPAVLGLETATFCGGVAVVRRGTVLGELMLRSPRSHSERLIPAIESLLGPLGLTTGDLGAVSVSAGPGSFTGLRVGVAAAKGLAFALDIPLYGVPTLELLAANAAPGAGAVRPLLDARRGELFTALYRFGQGRLKQVEEAGIVTPAGLEERLEPETLMVGEISPALRERISRRFRGVHFASPPLSYPRASAAALAGAERLAAGAPSETASLAPTYLRPSDAEAGRAAKQKNSQ